MRRRFLAALLVALVLLPLSAQAAGGHVMDLAGLLSGEEKATLERQAQEIEAAYGCGLYIVTVEDYRDYADHPFDAACDIYRYNDLGAGADQDGLILLLSMDDRDFATALYGPLAHAAFSDYALERQEEEFLDNFRYDDWYGGFADFLTTSEQALAAAAAGTPVDPADSQPVLQGTYRGGKALTLERAAVVFGQDLLWSLIFVLAVCLVFKAKMKSVKAKTTAREYMRADESYLRVREDRFTHTTHTRRTIQRSRSSGGGGASHSHHSGGFSGRSGKF